MSWQIGLLVFPGVQQLDMTAPYEVFASLPGASVHLLWKDTAPLASSAGLTLVPTTAFSDCPPLDVLCVPGGRGVDALLDDTEVVAFVRAQANRARYVTSVCTGALVLGAAGLLRGRRATTHWASRDLLARFGAITVADRVVRDGSLITAGGVTAGIDFGLTVVAELAGRIEAEAVGLILEYAPRPPFGDGLPEQASPEAVALVRQRMAASRRAREAITARLTGTPSP